MLGWTTYMNIIMKPTNSPTTQGQPNPRKIRSKVAFGPLYPTANIFFVGWDRFLFKKMKNVSCETDDNGNADVPKLSFQTIQKRNRMKIRSYRRYEEHGKKMFVFLGLFVHAAVRGGNCAFTSKIINTLVKDSSRDDRPSITT